jgi:glycerate 2-kinase
MLQALGARLPDARGHELALGGAALSGLAAVDLSGLDQRLADVRVVLATDVDNPLLGERGAAAVYAPQKGASADEVELLEAGLERWAELVDPDAAMRPGAGAAGGVGYAAMAVLAAEPRPGIEVLLELAGFDAKLDEAALVVTGEGSLDRQTLSGKAPAGVARAARRRGIPVAAVCGQRDLSDAQLESVGIDAVYALTDEEADVSRCMAEPAPILRRLGRRIAAEMLRTASR